ncbi:trypsin-like serine peptidase [Lutimaribacter marinistellae]|uniref:Trypsin-like serine peptidase n=1 Tax=Lutimaribacter marinistellae TaxID=1820329 RepID=A0ABV7TMM5_9RHOB
MPFGKLRLLFLSESEPSPESVLILDSVAIQSSKLTPYSVYGENQLQPINGPEVPEAARAMAGPVAFLSFIEGGRARTCSGFLIDSNRLLTNEHCVSTPSVCATTTVVFGYEYDLNGRLGIGPQRRCVSVDEAKVNFELDASVIELDSPPGEAFGTIDISAPGEDLSAPLMVIQHPGSQPKQISILDCTVNDPLVDGRGPGTDFTHTCDTAGGSSGAPILDAQGRLVGLHHFGFEDGEVWTANRGVHAELIANWLSTPIDEHFDDE